MSTNAKAPFPITIPRDRLVKFCRQHNVRRLSLFGSILRSDFTAHSDVDFLVEFEPGKTPGYLGLAAMEIELTEIIGRKADLRTPEELSSYFRDEVLREAVLQYEQEWQL